MKKIFSIALLLVSVTTIAQQKIILRLPIGKNNSDTIFMKYIDTAALLNGRLSSIVLNNTGILHTTPLTFVRAGGAWTGTQTLANQSAYKVFGTGATTATPTFRGIDSNHFNGAFQTQVRAAQAQTVIDTTTRFGGLRTIYKAFLDSVTFQTAIALKANRAAPTFTGTATFDSLTANNTAIKYNYNRFSNVVGDSAFISDGKATMLYGTSITAGFAIGSGGLRYSTLYTYAIGTTEINNGRNGSTLVKLANGDSSFIDRLPNVPSYSTGYRNFVLEYGTNDAVNAGIDTTTWRNSLSLALDTLIARGWTSRLVFVGNQYSATAKSLQFDTISAGICLRKGIIYVSMYKVILGNGGFALMSDGVHPNYAGARIIAGAINNSFITTQRTYQRINGDHVINGNQTISGNINGSTTTNINLGSLNFQNIFPKNHIILYDGGATNSNWGLGMTSAANLAIFSGSNSPNYNLMLGAGNTALTMTTANAAMYISGDNKLNFNTNIKTSLKFDNAVSINNIILYDAGGTPSTRWGLGMTSAANLALFARGTSYNLLLGTGQDATTMTTANAAMYIDGSNLINFTSNINNGFKLNNVVGINKILLYDNTLTTGRWGFGLDAAANFVNFVGNGYNHLFGHGVDATTITTANADAYFNTAGNYIMKLAPTVTAFAAAGLVTNNAAGLLATSTGTGFVKSTAGVISYDANTYLPNVLTTTGDIVYSSAGSTAARLPITNGVLFGNIGSIPSYTLSPILTNLTATGRLRASSISLNKDSIPITTSDIYALTVDTTTGIVTRRVLNTVTTAYAAKTANYTLTATDQTIEVTTAAVTITLPTAVGITGREYFIVNSSGGSITLATTSSQLIGNFTTSATLTIVSDNSFSVVSNGTKWLIK